MRRRPPHVLLRTVVAPVVVLSTITLLATGLLLLGLGEATAGEVSLQDAA